MKIFIPNLNRFWNFLWISTDLNNFCWKVNVIFLYLLWKVDNRYWYTFHYKFVLFVNFKRNNNFCNSRQIWLLFQQELHQKLSKEFHSNIHTSFSNKITRKLFWLYFKSIRYDWYIKRQEILCCKSVESQTEIM